MVGAAKIYNKIIVAEELENSEDSDCDWHLCDVWPGAYIPTHVTYSG